MSKSKLSIKWIIGAVISLILGGGALTLGQVTLAPTTSTNIENTAEGGSVGNIRINSDEPEK